MKRNTLLLLVFLIPYCGIYAQSSCQNEDFEASTAGQVNATNQVTGWSVFSGAYTNSVTNCSMTSCCANTPSESAVFNAPNGAIDPVIGLQYPIYSVFGATPGNTLGPQANPQLSIPMKGNNFFRINNNLSNGMPARRALASKTIFVWPNNSIMDVAFIMIGSTAHPCCSGASFEININNSVCPYVHVEHENNCSTPPVNYLDVQTGLPPNNQFGAVTFNKWKLVTIDLSQYIGQTVTVNFISAYCTAGGHHGTTYIDAQCGSGLINLNGNMVLMGSGATTLTSCSPTAVVTIPQYYGNYQWTGPGGFTSTANTISTTVAGTYTLNLSQGSICSEQTKTMTIAFSTASANITSSDSVSCPGVQVTLTATGLQTYTWNNGSNLAGMTANPTITTTYSVTGLHSNGCPLSALFTQSVFPQMPLTIASSQSAICPGDTAMLFGSGGLSYTWNPGNSNFPSITVTPTSSTTYSVSMKDVNGCFVSGSFTQKVYPQPTVSVVFFPAIICEGDIVTIKAYGLNTYTWTLGGNGPVISHTVNSSGTYFVDGHNGDGCYTYTLFALNALNCVGLTDEIFQDQAFRIFPNPNLGEFVLMTSQPFRGDFILENSLGQIVHSQIIISGENKIKTKELPGGIYYYSLIEGRKRVATGRMKLEQ